jgi:hypothetical protein
MDGAVEINRDRKRRLVEHKLMKAHCVNGDGQAARATPWPKICIHNTFGTFLGAKLKFAPFVNAVQGLGYVVHAFWIMLWTEFQRKINRVFWLLALHA